MTCVLDAELQGHHVNLLGSHHPGWGGHGGETHSTVPENSCDCMEVTLGDREGADSGQSLLPKLHYVGKMHPEADAEDLRISEKSSFGLTET